MTSRFWLWRLLWEAPQSTLGAALALGVWTSGRAQNIALHRGRITLETETLGVSLGHFVFYTRKGSRYFPRDDWMLQHELGHAVQSRWLGPLYLPLVGLPSSARFAYAVAYRELRGKRWTGYFDGWPEDSADRLGGVPKGARSSAPRSAP